MNAWETDDEYAAAAQRPLPTPVDTPSRNSSRHSRRSRRKKSVSPVHASSPGPIPHAEREMHNRRESRDVTTDENISILDPRRFTPTLHANLVAEILNLRRDQEEKIRAIEGLEETLHASKGEVEELSSTLSSNAKENRSLKRQLALLEGGTSNALGELARERDEAVESVSDMKRRLDASQKKVRAQEVDSDRVHGLWAQDKDTWEDERRKLERKVHVAEGRLKTVLDEVAAYQASHPVHESEAEDVGGHGSDTASVRSMSMTNSVRFSMLPGGGSKLNGMSLADELDFGDDDELSQMYQDGRESVLSNTHGRESVLSTHGRESVLSTTHRRNLSRDSMMSRTHKHTQSIESVRRPGSVARGRLLANQSVLEKLEGRIAEGDETMVFSKPEYVDSSTQYTPPPSPTSNPAVLPDAAADPQLRQVDNAQGGETEANQRRKRVRASTPVAQVAPNAADTMVSSACQTVDAPLSPPRTPTTPTVVAELEKEPMVTISTQTEGEWMLVPKAPAVPPIIPSISIHPPTSRPATPKESLLPQYFKDVACQASMQVSVPYSTASVQTEEIRVDKRLNLLPLHLQPSSISSCPPSPEPTTQPAGFFTPGVVPPPRNPRRKKSNQSIGEPPSSPPVPMRSPPAPPMAAETHDSYPGNNDDGPLSTDKGIRRPPRISSLFAGFENVSSDDADDFADGDLSDSDFRTALSAPRPRKSLNRGKRNSTAPTSVPEDEEPVEEAVSNHVKKQPRQAQGGYDANGEVIRDSSNMSGAKSPVMRTIRQFDKPLSLVMPPARPAQPQTMRRAALISNGIAAHQGRSRSPSLPDAVKEPPFPIPTRASSRKPPFSASAPSDGSRSPTREPWSRRTSSRGHYRVNSIRKVRSAAALPDVGGRPRRRGSRSPPPFSPSTEAPESPQLPPMPNNEITSPFMGNRDNRSSYGYSTHRKQPSNTTANTFNTNQSAGSSVQATSVVDAIAQTMVGEWMFKYVRRRKSFGVPEGTLDNDASNGVRHKRWVWLAPYERAVMWSSKQPTSGSALMGKSGRKLTIQSVLDVKDDNAAPKGVNNLFNRSILILTPARALKFTATSRERHYIWLTALSFLAHSSQAIPEVMAPHPPPSESGNFDILRQNGARLQKQPIRDSIRVAKGRTILSTQSGPTTAQSSIHRGEYSIRTDTSTRGGASITDHSVKDIGASGPDGFVPDAADPPIVPRFTDRALINGISHGRKRSNTGSRIPPPLSFRGFSERGPLSGGGSSNGGGGGGGGFSNYGHAPAGSTAGMSVGTNGSSDVYTASQRSSSVMGGNSISFSNGMSNSNRTSIRTSDASSRPGAVVNNFFEAVGTVRMEAFISPLAFPRSDDYPVQIDDLGGMGKGMSGASSTRSGANRRRSKERRRRSRNRDSYYNGGRHRAYPPTDVEDWYGGSRTAGEEESRGGRERDDPFRGF